MQTFFNKTAFITGSSRGIGREIALRLAREGANIIIAAKTTQKHPKLSGTIYTVAEEIEKSGGKAVPICVDIRDEANILQAVEEGVNYFGGIDILINNASAIQLTSTLETPLKRFDLLFGVNVRGTFACSQACIPYLKKSANGHILNIAPPLNLAAKWFKDHLAYTMSKYGMSMCTLGMSAEFARDGIAVNSLWPKTSIATSAVEVFFPKEVFDASRNPTIVADAAYYILKSDSKKITGNFFIDEDVLRQNGVTDFSKYSVNPKVKPYADFFL